MTLIALMVLLILIGVALYLIPMDARIKTVIVVVVILGVLLWVARYAGVL